MNTVKPLLLSLVAVWSNAALAQSDPGSRRDSADSFRYEPRERERLRERYEAEPQHGWRARNLLQGPAALVKGLGASLYCIGNSSYVMFRDVHSFQDGFVQSLLWPWAITLDSIGSFAAYTGVGTAHTLTGGALVSDPPKQIEEMSAPIYCVLSDNM